VVTGLADGEHRAGDPYGQPTLLHNLFGHLASARRPCYFFARYSSAISALIFSSRYIFMRRRFSSYSSFMRGIMEVSMPPNLARHL
jgi:hypothetical protein